MGAGVSEWAEQRQLEQRQRGYTGEVGSRKSLSEVGGHTPTGVLKCPRCGSTNFTAKRSMVGKVSFGVLAMKSQVRCVACGMMFKRG
jgi:hypothetical protein